jgi:hypothetical protein
MTTANATSTTKAPKRTCSSFNTIASQSDLTGFQYAHDSQEISFPCETSLGLGNDCGSANAQTNLVSDLEVRP